MLDEERILYKIAELGGYLKKLREITQNLRVIPLLHDEQP